MQVSITVIILMLGAASVHQPVDEDRDGFPDASELRIEADRGNFRRWFATIALSSYLNKSDKITDCAQFVNYVYREALKAHDESWRVEFGELVDPSIPDLVAFSYPEVPYIGTDIFRLAEGPYASNDLDSGKLGNFADVPHLQKYHTFPVSRELSGRIEEGDLLFFNPLGKQSHVMIYVEINGEPYLVYHTGPDTSEDGEGSAGEMRLIEFETLMSLDDETWRPDKANPAFAGFYRFKILDGI